MFTLATTRPLAWSICEGRPTPIASGGPVRATTSATAASIPSSSAPGLASSVGRSTASSARAPSIRATATFVPPTSTPRTFRGLLPSGSHSVARGRGVQPRLLAARRATLPAGAIW
jgi:hypothetical protein